MDETSQQLEGKICLITGANSGIGKVTALQLARMGATVVLVSRDLARGERVRQEIRQQSGSQSVDLLKADLASQEDIRRLAREFQQHYQHLHLLINNAGGVFPNRGNSPDGIERTFAVNYLAPFLLTNLLLETLKASAPARIVNVGSDAHYMRAADPDDWRMERGGYRMMRAYAQSKLALVLFTYALERRLRETGVTVNVLHPGVVATNIWAQPLPRFLHPLGALIARFFAVSPQEGARTTLYLASAPEVEGVSGKYYEMSKEKQSARISYDQEVQESLWTLSEQMTHLTANV